MNYFDELAKRIRRNEPVAAPWRAALQAASVGQRVGMWIRRQRGSVRVPAHVISFGNVTAGGTGKTPAVIDRALCEIKRGRQVAVITRGYGAAPERMPLIMNGNCAEDDIAKRFGDEAALIALRVPGIWIVRSPDRVKGAYAAMERGCDTLILDDGYQALRLARDENVLLIDATNPFGNGFILPRGLLREPLSALSRATEIMITRCDQAPEALPGIESTLRRFTHNVPIRYFAHKPVALKGLWDRREYPLEMLRDASVRAVCGIGNPESFAKTLAETGANVVGMDVLGDHAIIPEACLRGNEMIVMTEKDAARTGGCALEHVYALCISIAPYMPANSTRTSM